LLDAQLTAGIYLELVGGRQTRLVLAPRDVSATMMTSEIIVPHVRPEPLPPRITPDEIAVHAAFVAAELGAAALWNWL
jgi:DNA polymerase-3 subunit epsilon